MRWLILDASMRLPLWKNMDDVKLKEAQDSLINDSSENLAQSIDFQKSGASTQNKEIEATTKSGVLFLTGDKALSDKLNAIVDKVKVRAKKSEALTEWANLMLLQSKIQANDLIFEKTAEMLKEDKEEQKRKLEESRRKNEAEMRKLERESMKATKDLDSMLNNYGESAQWFGENPPKVSELAEYAKGIDSLDSKLSSDGKELDTGNKLNQKRSEFYSKYGKDKNAVGEIVKQIDEFQKKHSDVDNGMLNYLFACLAVDKFSTDGSFIASPADLCIVVANDPDAEKRLKDSKNDKIWKNVINLNDFVISGLDKTNAVKFRDEVVKSRDFDIHAVFCFSRLFSQKSNKAMRGVNESEKKRIMKSVEFINEDMIKTSMTMREADLAIMDILDDCDGGCLYVGNFEGLGGIDYIMMDGNGSYGFFVERGNIDAALRRGEPIDPYPVDVYDNEKLELLNIVVDKVSEDILMKLA